MNPRWYRSSAIFIACAAPYPRRFASARNAVVLNGTGGHSSFSFFRYSRTFPTFASRARWRAAFASVSTQNRPCSCAAGNVVPALSNVADTDQKSCGVKSSISRSRFTISARVGLWTRPTERKSRPSCFEAMEMKRVRAAPHARSTIWRDSADSARGTSMSTRFAKDSSISAFVREEYRARFTATSGFTFRMTSRASVPMSSPSRSKSVATITSSTPPASSVRASTMPGSVTRLIGSTHTSSFSFVPVQLLNSSG
ncbi:MAG: hypothetical protein A3K65_06510 [Euryarchaeota archaeon RBG_16_68_12]|nr:MAG: hypothetical protein A3K65_06510 [Euryarchaeota archaeon RBG_16_68_12]